MTQEHSLPSLPSLSQGCVCASSWGTKHIEMGWMPKPAEGMKEAADLGEQQECLLRPLRVYGDQVNTTFVKGLPSGGNGKDTLGQSPIFL